MENHSAAPCETIKSPKVVAVIQARMSSSRLPGKSMLELDGIPALGHIVKSALNSMVDEVVVATSDLEIDDVIADYASSLGVRVVRGPLDDVLTRFTMAARESDAEVIVRLTADNPLLDESMIDFLVRTWSVNSSYQYVTNAYGNLLPLGFSVELITVAALSRIDLVADGYHRSHVTSYAYTHPDDFSCLYVSPISPGAGARFTLDTVSDLSVIRDVFSWLAGRKPDLPLIYEYLSGRELSLLPNADVKQKRLEEG